MTDTQDGTGQGIKGMAHFLIIPFYCTDVCYRPSSPFPGDTPPSLITLCFGNLSTCKCLNLQNRALHLPMLNNPPSVLHTGICDPRHNDLAQHHHHHHHHHHHGPCNATTRRATGRRDGGWAVVPISQKCMFILFYIAFYIY